MHPTFHRDRFTWLVYLSLAYYAYFLNVLGPITPFLKDELQLSYTVSSFHFTAFAMMEMKITLAILLQKYHFTLLPNQRIDRVGMTGSLPKYGIKMRIGKPGEKPIKVPVRGNVHKLVTLTD